MSRQQQYEVAINTLLDHINETDPGKPFVFRLSNGNIETTDYKKVQKYIKIYEETVRSLMKERDEALGELKYYKNKYISQER